MMRRRPLGYTNFLTQYELVHKFATANNDQTQKQAYRNTKILYTILICSVLNAINKKQNPATLYYKACVESL